MPTGTPENRSPAPTHPMRVTLLLPGLLWPRRILRDAAHDLDLPALSLLVGRASSRRPGAATVDAWLAKTFGLGLPLPAAPLRLLGDGGMPGNDEWLCLDPVHLRLESRTAHAIMLDDPALLALTAEEDAALRQALAPLFSEMGEIVATSPGHWHLCLSRPAGIESQPLADVVGRAVDPSLPAGPEGARWRRLLAEAQTLLFDHPVNRTRREAGHPPVNSLWPWGMGSLPVRITAPFDAVLCDDPVIKGLARAVNLTAAAAPVRFVAKPGRTLVRLDALADPTRTFDALAWREALVRLEADWFAPLLAALRAGRCRSAMIVGGSGNGAATLEISLTRARLWRFWRRPQPLDALPES